MEGIKRKVFAKYLDLRNKIRRGWRKLHSDKLCSW
jgi:hypothetical protein